MRKFKRIELHIIFALLTIGFLIVAGATFYKIYEHMAWVDAFYFTITTVMTIGYGDFRPTSSLTKIVTMFYALISVPTVVFCLGLIVEDYFEERVHKIEEAFNDSLIKKPRRKG
ncbi:MAG: potassium channel family protein [Candidatus Berkelbacteria bacterium]|nr:potassium channel family protein [Candidatus Berkelbacteria bacterium]